MEKIVYIGELDRTPQAPDHLGIRQGLEYYDGLVVDPLINNRDQVVKQIQDFNPDIIVHGNTDSLGQGLAPILRGEWKQVFWMLDYQPDINNYHWHGWNTDGYDMVLLSNKDQINDWSQRFNAPCHFLTHGCVVQKPIRDEKEHNKAVFIGSISRGDWYDWRADLLDRIKFTHITADDVDGRNKIWSRMPAIYHTSDCVIDVSHSWEADGYASGRYFYAGGLGACSITRRFPGCEELYPADCKAYFDTPEEAMELIEYYHTHPEEREAMKLRAWQHNKNHHHYKFKFKKIIELLNEA